MSPDPQLRINEFVFHVLYICFAFAQTIDVTEEIERFYQLGRRAQSARNEVGLPQDALNVSIKIWWPMPLFLTLFWFHTVHWCTST
jgi:hypothetical protein